MVFLRCTLFEVSSVLPAYFQPGGITPEVIPEVLPQSEILITSVRLCNKNPVSCFPSFSREGGIPH